MTRLVFLLASILAITSAAGTARAQSAAARRSARAPVLDPASRAALAFLPFDTALVGSIHVDWARRSPMGQRLIDTLESDRDFRRVVQDLRKQVGFDYEEDIERVWLAVPARSLDGGDEIAFVARLTIDEKRFVKWLRRQHRRRLDTRRAGSSTYYVVRKTAWAFLDRRHLLIAHAGYVEEVLAAATGRVHNAAANRALVQAAAQAGRPDAHAWLAVLVPDSARTRLQQDVLTAPLADVRFAASRVRLGDVTQWRAQVETSRRESARQLVGVLRQMLDTAAASREVVAAGLAAALRGTAVAARGNTVHLRGSLPGARAGAVIDAVLAP
jgi:hypothetical protein